MPGPLSNVMSSVAFGDKLVPRAGLGWLCELLSGMTAKRTDKTLRLSGFMGWTQVARVRVARARIRQVTNSAKRAPESAIPIAASQVVVQFVAGTANLVACAQEMLHHRPHTSTWDS